VYIILDLILSLVLLIISSMLFTESVEQIGNSLNFAHSFTGAIISPLFTSVPELVVIIISIVIVGGGQGSDIASGTIIGEPFMVSSLGFFLLSLSYIIGRNNFKSIKLDNVFSRTFIVLSIVFPIMLIPVYFHGLFSKIFSSILLALIYILLLSYYRKKGTNISEESEKREKTFSTLIKLSIGFIILLIGSDLLIKTINSISISYRIDAEVVSILIIPIGTILPETMNAVIWAFKGKINLAIGALIGEEVLFATFYPIIGILFTRWLIDRNGSIAIILTSVFSFITGILILKNKGWQFLFLLSFMLLGIFIGMVFY